jgi:aldehyde:ferredoxin oxidoreductase
MLGGYAHKLACIDLSTGQVEYFAPDPKDLEMYVGGRGLGVKYVYENGPKVDPLGPENLLCMLERTLYIQTIYVSIGFFLAPCKHPSHLRVFTADTGGSAGTFPLVETLGFEAQQQDGLG